ncbi:MAG TPA: mannose-6-phosphate isomerase, class I [Chitinophagaceae bacterium]|nr:mannose-6-phosphate isomerase, class I [Chitinophagaceae bacterium]
MSFEQDKIFKLKGKVQHYAWGGFEFIPHWLGIENTAHKPYAEFWMGAHPSASAALMTNEAEILLHSAVQNEPARFLGQKVFKQFGELPYLFKILDVKDMLSIQVHPTKAGAIEGYEAEEAAGVLLQAPSRNYKDKNHKPEVMVALSEFWLLHGFLEKEALLEVLMNTPEFGGMEDIFNLEGYKGLYQYVMELPQEEVNSLLTPLVKRELKAKEEGSLTKKQPGWWVSKLYGGKDADIIDRGVFSIYFFNIVKALPGEAIFQGAGVPHAYLEGQNVELMANSDNVLRGGLTPKHVDVPQLLKHTVFEGTVVNIMPGEKLGEGEAVYNCPVPDFGISKIGLVAGQQATGSSSSMEIIVVIDGLLQVQGSNTIHARSGEAVAILPGENYRITTTQHVLAYKAFVP